MKLFEEPKMEVAVFSVEDIITTSEDPALFDDSCF